MKNIVKIISVFIWVFFLVNLYSCDKDPATVYYSQEGKFTIPFGKNYDYTDILVKRAVDGDTLVLENGERVRLIGIDTPEMHESNKLYRDAQRTKQDISTIQKLGRRAYEFTKKLVEGKHVRLEFDVEKHDRYGRLLAYVYDIETYKRMIDILSPAGYEIVNGNEIFINATIIKSGYASLMTIPPNVKYADLFLQLYREARENRRGLWER